MRAIIVLTATLSLALGTANFAYAQSDTCTDLLGCVKEGADYYTMESGDFLGANVVNNGNRHFNVALARAVDIPIGLVPADGNIALGEFCVPSTNGFFYQLQSDNSDPFGKITIRGTRAGGTFDISFPDIIFFQFKDPACSQLDDVQELFTLQSSSAVWSPVPAPGQTTVPGVDGENPFPNSDLSECLDASGPICINLWSNLERGVTNFFPQTPVIFFSTDGSIMFVLSPMGLPYTAPLEVGIAIDPPKVAPVPIELGGGTNVLLDLIDSVQIISVAILSTPTFDATTVDPTSVAFGPAGAHNVLLPRIEDVNHDGRPDLVLGFVTGATGVACGDEIAILTGKTVKRQPIAGMEAIQTLGCPN